MNKHTLPVSPVEAAAWAYMAGHSFGLDDNGALLLICNGRPDPALVTACEANIDALRRMTYEGISATLEGYQPALDGLEERRLADA